MIRSIITFVAVLAIAAIVGLMLFNFANQDPAPEILETDNTSQAIESRTTIEPNPFRDSLVAGETLIAALGPCSEAFPNLGTLSCDEQYRVVYDASTEEWTVTGPLSAATPRVATHGPVRAEDDRLTLWGARFTFDSTGRIVTPQGVPVGQLSNQSD